MESRPVAPAYYGPNAFPIPEMGFGRTCSELSLEAGAALALHKGFSIREDATADAYFKLRIPLFTPRVNLVIWGEAYDWFRAGAAANATRGVEGACSGGKVGELFVSTDIHALRQEKHYVDLMVRAALKSAAGDFHNIGDIMIARDISLMWSWAENLQLARIWLSGLPLLPASFVGRQVPIPRMMPQCME